MNKEELLSVIRSEYEEHIDMLELVYNAIEGNSICIHVFSGITALEKILNKIEYPHTAVVIQYLNSLQDCSSHVYVNLGSTIKVYWGSTADNRAHGVTLSVEGTVSLPKEYYTDVKNTLLYITKSSVLETVEYTPIAVVPLFSYTPTNTTSYLGYYSAKNRYYVLLFKSRFNEFLFEISRFIYAL